MENLANVESIEILRKRFCEPSVKNNKIKRYRAGLEVDLDKKQEEKDE